MVIEYADDGKGKYQSWEAKASEDGSTFMGAYSIGVVGWGETKEQAHENLRRAMTAIRAALATIE